MAVKDKDIELRSDEIQDILGKIPPWLIRRGMMGIALVILVLLAIAAWFKYPDRITSQIQLTTDHPPVHLVARTTAKIDEFFVEDGQEVNAGDLLVVLESPANYKDVLSIRDLVTDLATSPETADTNALKEVYALNNLELGNLQGDLAALQRSIQELLDFLRFDKYEIQIQGKETEHYNYRVLDGRLWDQWQLREEELKLGESQFKRDSLLHLDGTYSDVQYETSKQNYLNLQSQFVQAKSAMSFNKIEMTELEQEISDLKIQRRDEKLNAYAKIQESKDQFLGALADWEQKYLLVSPIQGLISLGTYYSVNQEVKLDTRVLSIVQEETGPIVGKVLLPNLGAGKVKEGHPVIVRFDRYPYMEFGMVSGVINKISLVPEEANYYVEVGFPDGLTTSYNQELEFTQEMTGQADIITEDRTFLVRIISPLKSMLKRNSLE